MMNVCVLLSWQTKKSLRHFSQLCVSLLNKFLVEQKRCLKQVRKNTLSQGKNPIKIPTATAKEADGNTVMKLRGIIHLHKTFIPKGSEQEGEEATEEGNRGWREGG